KPSRKWNTPYSARYGNGQKGDIQRNLSNGLRRNTSRPLKGKTGSFMEKSLDKMGHSSPFACSRQKASSSNDMSKSRVKLIPMTLNGRRTLKNVSMRKGHPTSKGNGNC